MKKRFLACLAAVILLTTALPLASFCLAETKATVISMDVLHLRDYPGTSGNIIGRYRHGTRVTVLSTKNKAWTRVRTPDGKVGYMYRKYLSTFSSTGSDGQVTVTGSTTRYIRSGIGPVNFRKKASANSRLLDQLYGGTRVTVLSQGATWSKVKYNGTLGYIKTKYLTTTKGK